jgi:hypothetical protein
MSTIKKKFNIWTVLMFVWCLALSIIITQPLLARAGNEWWNDVIIDTTFSDTRSMSLDTLDIFNTINIWNSRISKSGIFLSICTSWNCVAVKKDKVYTNQIQLWEGHSAITFSGNMILNADWTGYILFDDVNEIDAKNEDIITWLKKYNTQEILYTYGLFDFKTVWGISVADIDKPRFANKTQWYAISFKENSENSVCSSANAWSLHYIEYANWSKLTMCMKMSDWTYSGVVLQDTTN